MFPMRLLSFPIECFLYSAEKNEKERDMYCFLCFTWRDMYFIFFRVLDSEHNYVLFSLCSRQMDMYFIAFCVPDRGI